MNDLPTMPAAQIFAEWEANLRALTELPLRLRNERSVVSEPPAPPYGYIDYIANGYADPLRHVTADTDQYSIDGFNRRVARKTMFTDYGWPGDFRADEFKQARQAWMTQDRCLDKDRDCSMDRSLDGKRAAF